MRTLQIIIVVLLVVATSILGIILYKHYRLERADVLNIATLTASIIAIIALFVNAGQYVLNKDKRLFEVGEFRIEKYYKVKISRIEALKVMIPLNVNLVNKGRGFELNGGSLHTLQHTLIQYLRDIYSIELTIPEIYLSTGTTRADPTYLEFLNTLKSFYNGLDSGSMRIINYHRQYLAIIRDISRDRNISRDQKENFISSLLLKELLGYNMIINEKQNNNFKIVTNIDSAGAIQTIGYLDYLKSVLPSKQEYLRALGPFKNIFERDLPK